MAAGSTSVKPWAALMLLVFCLLLAGGMLSYTVAGEPRVGILRGQVLDSDGKPVIGAFVTITTSDYSQSFDVKTAAEGRWIAPRTPVGFNTITVQRRGYYMGRASHDELKEARTVTAETVYLAEAPDSVNIGVHYPQTVQPGRKKGLYVSGTYNQPSAVVSFSVYPYDIVRSKISSEGEYNYRQEFIRKQLDGLAPIASWQRTYETSQYDGSFTGAPAVPPIDKPGGYIVVAKLADIKSADVLNVSRIAVIAKNDGRKLLTYTVDSATGKPLQAVMVQAYEDSNLISESVSSEEGLLEIDVSSHKSALVVAYHKGSIAIANSYNYDRSDTVSLVYTDRPIYRPGHTVHFKGIFRRKSGGGYQPISGQQINYTIIDSEGSKVGAVTATTNENGTASGSWQSSSTGNLGYYTLSVDQPGISTSRNFSVEEYRKPEYSVTVEPQQEVFVQGQPFKALVQANYFFGAPVADSQVNYTVFTSPHYYAGEATDLELWADSSYEEFGYDYGGYGEVVKEGKGVTDKDGRLLIELPTKGVGELSRWNIEVSVVDASMKESSSRAGAIVAPAAFHIDPRPDDWVIAPAEKSKITVNNVWWNDAAPQPVTLDVKVEKVSWGDKREHRETIQESSIKIPASSEAAFEFSLKEPGYYEIIFRGKDSQGRVSEASSSVYVYESGEEWNAWQEPVGGPAVTVVPQKNIYQPGQTANVLVGAMQKGPGVLVTLQGERLFRQWVIPGGVQQMLEIPLLKEYGTGVIINASVVQNGKMSWNEARIAISPEASFLSVQIKSSKPVYKPGEMAEYSIQTLDKSGKGVPAEVSFGVVDESIYALRADYTPDLQKFYWGPATDNVTTASSLEDYYYGGVNKFEANPRKYFPDTAYWNPTVRTDATGFAYVSFKMPDNLTTWRATARAVTSDTRVGQAVQKCLVTKDLVVRLQAPRFFRQKDRMTVGVIVHNYTDKPQNVSIRLKAAGLKQSGDLVRTAKIKAGGLEKVTYPIEVITPGEARLTAEAITEDRSAIDALQLDFPVLPYGMPDFHLYSGKAETRDTVSVALPDGVVKGSEDLVVHVTPSPIGAALQGIEYLADYPWGCTEQTVSSFVPNVLLNRAMADLGYPVSSISQEKLQDMINSGVRRLKEMQNPDGSWGFFSEGDADEAMTAYAVQSLMQAKNAGVNIPGDLYGRGADWLGRRIQKDFPKPPEKVGGSYRLLLENRAQSVLAVAQSGKQVQGKVRELYAVRKHATDFALATIGLAAVSQGMQPEAVQVADDLLTRAKRGSSWVYWSDSLNWSFISDQGATAQAAKLLISLGGKYTSTASDALIWLAANRQGDRWYSTRDTAAVISAMIDYLAAVQPAGGSVSITFDGRPVKNVSFTAADTFRQPVPIRVPANLLSGRNKQLAVQAENGSVFWTAKLSFYNSQPTEAASKSYFSLSRKLYRVRVSTNRGVAHEKLTEVGNSVQVGETIRLKLELNSKGASAYNLIEIPLPAGFEVVSRERQWHGSYSGEQVRDNRIGLFARWTGQGKHSWTYDIRPEVPGRISLMPARIEAMYKPEWNAHTDIITVDVKN